jgi:hypothetical protein
MLKDVKKVSKRLDYFSDEPKMMKPNKTLSRFSKMDETINFDELFPDYFSIKKKANLSKIQKTHESFDE